MSNVKIFAWIQIKETYLQYIIIIINITCVYSCMCVWVYIDFWARVNS